MDGGRLDEARHRLHASLVWNFRDIVDDRGIDLSRGVRVAESRKVIVLDARDASTDMLE